jgi:signal peptidase I
MDIYRNVNLSADMIREILEKNPFYKLKVYGGSMLPLLRHGEEIIIRRIPMDSIRIGDVLFCQHEDQFLAHRVVLIMAEKDRPRAVVTKGDTLTYLDPVSTEEQILGRVTATVRKGKLADQTAPGIHGFNVVIAMISSFGLYLGFPLIKLNEMLGRGRLPFFMPLLRMICAGPAFLFALCAMPFIRLLSKCRIDEDLRAYFITTAT